MMTTRERIARMYAHKEADRIPVMDSPWEDTLDRWEREGMPCRDYIKCFDLDRTAYISVDNSPRYPERVLEETDEYKIYTTSWGVTRRSWKHMTSTPEDLDFTVKTPDDWREAKARMVPTDDRIPWKYLQENYPKWRAEGRWITGGFWFGYDITHSGFVGTERLLEAMAEDPEWCSEMFEHELDVDIALMNRVWEAGYQFDELHWYDDMGYKNRTFFSLRMYRDVLKKSHQRAIDWGHAHGIPVRLHSCGNIMTFVPELVDMGLDGLNPLEIKAGMDPVALKKQFGDRLLLHGGINAVLWDKPEQISAAIRETIPRLMENGGYIFASDHSIPSSVSYKDFTDIISLVKEVGTYR